MASRPGAPDRAGTLLHAVQVPTGPPPSVESAPPPPTSSSSLSSSSAPCLAKLRIAERDRAREPGVLGGSACDHLLTHFTVAALPVVGVTAVMALPFRNIDDGLWVNGVYLMYQLFCWHLFFAVAMAVYVVALVAPPLGHVWLRSCLPAAATHFGVFLSLNSVAWPFPVGTVIGFSFAMPVFFVLVYFEFKRTNRTNLMFNTKFRRLTIAVFAHANSFITCVAVLALFWHAETAWQQELLAVAFTVIANVSHYVAARSTRRYVVLSGAFAVPVKSIQSTFQSVVLGQVRSEAVFWLLLSLDLAELLFLTALVDRRARRWVASKTRTRAWRLCCIFACGDDGVCGEPEEADVFETRPADSDKAAKADGHSSAAPRAGAASIRRAAGDAGGPSAQALAAAATLSSAMAAPGTAASGAGQSRSGITLMAPMPPAQLPPVHASASSKRSLEADDALVAFAASARAPQRESVAFSVGATGASVTGASHTQAASASARVSPEVESNDAVEVRQHSCVARCCPATHRALSSHDGTRRRCSLFGLGSVTAGGGAGSSGNGDGDGDAAAASSGGDVAAAPRRLSATERWRRASLTMQFTKGAMPTAEDDDVATAYDLVATWLVQATTSCLYFVTVPVIRFGPNRRHSMLGVESVPEEGYQLALKLSAYNAAAVAAVGGVCWLFATYVSGNNPCRTSNRRFLQRVFVNVAALMFAIMAAMKFLLYHTNADYLDWKVVT